MYNLMYNPVSSTLIKPEQLYQRDEDDEGNGPLILEHVQLLSHKDLHCIRQVVHRRLGRIQVQDQIAEVVHSNADGVICFWHPRVLALFGHDELWKSETLNTDFLRMCHHLEVCILLVAIKQCVCVCVRYVAPSECI